MYEHKDKYWSIQKYITIDVESSYRKFLHSFNSSDRNIFDAIKKGLNCVQKSS